MEGERRFSPKSLRNTKLGVYAAAGLSALGMSGEPAERPSAHWLELGDVPSAAGPSDVTFLGDTDPGLIESYYLAQQVSDRYWRGLGYERSDCDGALKVRFTDEFADRPDTDPDHEPAGWADPEICEEWLNSEELADNPWGMAYTHTHEEGHLKGFDHSEDPDSLMHGDNPDGEEGKEPPAGATEERFEQQFDVEMRFSEPGSE
ncbi:MAG: matrixin family metalloprotease [bacterium]|nr:matrixin family metalloprotease [bacterium]